MLIEGTMLVMTTSSLALPTITGLSYQFTGVLLRLREKLL